MDIDAGELVAILLYQIFIENMAYPVDYLWYVLCEYHEYLFCFITC